ncbi:MAG TPA: hypothetical protein PKX44_01925 [Methanomassiliicoccaceae archaeon]|nr:hypothetical protein [Methanomassiliicoccaceae archaeon]
MVRSDPRYRFHPASLNGKYDRDHSAIISTLDIHFHLPFDTF